MKRFRFAVGVLVIVASTAGILALAGAPDKCAQPGPPGISCTGCPTYEDPVVCTVRCAGGPQQKTFSNSCFASCSGYMILGECTRTGG